jgi:hypothetical protein
LAVFYLAVRYIPSSVISYIDGVPARITLLIILIFIMTNMCIFLYSYLFPPSALKRANTSWLISAWGAFSGFPATLTIYVITELEIFGESIFKVKVAELGGASFLVSVISFTAMYLFYRRYEYLRRPENRNWAERRPKAF